MTAQIRAELYKHRSTRTNLGLLAAMLGLILLVVLLHAVALPATEAARRTVQTSDTFGRGEMLAALFAALVGAMSITSEFRHGTIRPTLLVTPQRGRVIVAKVSASVLIGSVFGLIGAGFAAGAGSAALAARGIPIRLDGGDFALLLGGSIVASALLAAIGVGVGAAIRHQVPTVVGICAWLLFVEGLLVGDAGSVGTIGRYLPGALGNAASGQVPQLAAGPAMLLLAIYAAAAAAAGWRVSIRRDVA
ncbi:MAG: ABC transporter permease [Solirubrobacteraceae bacterium]